MTTFAEVRVGIKITKDDGCFHHTMFWCKSNDYGIRDWVRQELELFDYDSPVCDNTMKDGESRRYWATVRLESWRDYFGEWESSCIIVKLKRAH